MNIALVAIAKDEDPYIEEWIKYNLKLGFDQIHLYLNDWRYYTSNSRVKTIEFNGNAIQMKCYGHFLRNYSEQYDWAAFFDIDEFLVLKKHRGIKNFVGDVSNQFETNQIGINWVFFGDNGLSEFPDGTTGVLERFTKRQIGCEGIIKSIVKMSPGMYPENFINPHFYYHDGISPDGVRTAGPYNENGDTEIAQINHYFSKTREEFQRKISRGRADLQPGSPGYCRTWSEFDSANKNEIEDLDALEFFRNTSI
jgi:hypothetical protein